MTFPTSYPTKKEAYSQKNRVSATLLTLFLCLTFHLGGLQLLQAQDDRNLFVEGQLLVQLEEESLEEIQLGRTNISEILAIEGQGMKEPQRAFKDLGQEGSYWQSFFLLEGLKDSELAIVMEELSQRPGIASVTKVPLVQTTQVPPNDPQFSTQTNLKNVDYYLDSYNPFPTFLLPPVDNVVIAVIDDAVDIGHQDLSPNLWVNQGEIANNGIDDDGNGVIDDRHGADMADGDGDPSTPSNANAGFFHHGTHVAGIADAATHNGIGIAALAFNVELMSLKCAPDNTHDPSQFSLLAVIDAINYAAANGADIINLSLSTSINFPPLETAVNQAIASDAIVVAAAGNDNSSTAPFPAGYPDVVAVAATNSIDEKAPQSNFGSWVDLTAPGVDILSTLPNDQYGNLTGTSMACPLVVSTLALMKTYDPQTPNSYLIQCLINEADNIDALNPAFIGLLGGGRLNAGTAMECVANYAGVSFSQGPSNSSPSRISFFEQHAGSSPIIGRSWDFGDPESGVNNTSNLKNPLHQYSKKGTYKVCLTVRTIQGDEESQNICCKKIQIHETESSPSMPQTELGPQSSVGAPNPSSNYARLFPNPGSGFLNIQLRLKNPQQAQISVFDMRGALVDRWKTGHLTPGEHQLKRDLRSKGLSGDFLMSIGLNEEVINLRFQVDK